MDLRTPNSLDGANTLDLGAIEGPILVCGGAYSNLEALNALLDKARELSIPASRIIHTGDAVAYCADPAATTELLRKNGAHCIQGNVEESLSASLPDCGCGFDENSLCDRLAAEWFAFADERMDDAMRRWMGTLPHHLTFTIAGKRVRVVHGAVTSINKFMFESLPDSDFMAEIASADADMVIAGHSGIPFTRRIGPHTWHNSGPLGLPANDGTPRVWFSVLTPAASDIHIRHVALDYDHRTASEKMHKQDVCKEYADALVSGLWPSVDILPRAERTETGKPIKLEQDIVWRAAETAA